MKVDRSERHHTDLSMMHAIMQLCEGGSIYTRSGRATAAKIIKLCSAEAGKQLSLFDRAKAQERGQ